MVKEEEKKGLIDIFWISQNMFGLWKWLWLESTVAAAIQSNPTMHNLLLNNFNAILISPNAKREQIQTINISPRI